MPPSRKQHFPATQSEIWDLTPLLDHGDPALGDLAAVGFSLLPRVMDAPMLEHARLFLTVRFARGSVSPLSEAMRIVPFRAQTPPDYRQTTLGAWATVAVTAPAGLEGLRSHERRGGELTLSAHYHLHRTLPVVVWELAAGNQTGRPLVLSAATLLRVGPPRKVSTKRRSDFLPTRFRLFRLRRPPQAQSAYYNLTERFGSLRLHPLDPLSFATQTADPARVAFHLPEMPAGLALARAWALVNTERRRALVLAVGRSPFPAAWDFQVNDDPHAPGLTLRLTPTGALPALPPGGALTLPPVLLAWLDDTLTT